MGCLDLKYQDKIKKQQAPLYLCIIIYSIRDKYNSMTSDKNQGICDQSPAVIFLIGQNVHAQ